MYNGRKLGRHLILGV